jgi:prenyltransferase beta subunit
MSDHELNRRRLLIGAAVGAGSALLASARSQDVLGKSGHRQAWHSSVEAYLLKLARADGGFGWDDQDRSHLTPTFAVIGCLTLLGKRIPNNDLLVEFVRTHHPERLKKLEQEHRIFHYQQAQSLAWLNAEPSELRKTVASWQRPVEYLRQYEQHGYPVFSQEVSAMVSRKLLGLPLADLPAAYVSYLDSRRRASGSFNNTPASDGSDGNVLNTWWGLRALDCLARSAERKQETIEWLRDCQLASGGFTHQPRPEIAGVDDVAYTWAAVRSLALLGAAPADPAACLNYLHSLWNVDGGFADRPGWASNPLATYYALDSLAALGKLDEPVPQARQRPQPRLEFPAGLKVFSMQLEAHGQGSPAEAVALAHALKIHLWGAKNASPQWLARVQALADDQRVGTRFFVANEEYGTWVSVPGMGTYSHTSDIVAPADAPIGPSLAKQGVVPWTEYRQKRLDPLVAGGGRLVWQFGENEPLVRLLLDDSLERGGFAAISTFHFGNPDFTNSEPFLKRYRMQLPFVALQDAHGTEPWWFADMTEGFRTLFLATEPTWEGWLHALSNNWVVAVRHDAVSGNQTWMHGGRREVLDFVLQHASDWQWWDNPAIRRPLVSLVALSPRDEFETGRPESGITLRVRCAWQNTAQGLARQPIAELVKLVVDGERVEPKLVTRRRPNGLYADYFHIFALQPVPGRHTAEATARHLATGAELQKSIEFTG